MSTKIDMPIATSDLDSSGEILKIEHVDISDFLDGKAVANWEHNNDSPEDIVGRFTYAKKILKADDCENDRQRMYWQKIRKPFIYGICELYDDEGHAGAAAIAAMIRYFVKRKEPIQIGASIEGQTLERDGNVLNRAVARKCAITLKPCNKQCWIDLIEQVPESSMLKSERELGLTAEVDSILLAEPQDDLTDLHESVVSLRKALEAGNYNAAPSTLVQGAALQREEVVGKRDMNRMKAALRDWPRSRPLGEWLKSELPDISPKYVDHFAQIADDVSLRKGLPALKRIGAQHSTNRAASPEQHKLIEGLYIDPAKKADIGHANHMSLPPLKLQNDAGQDVFVKSPLAILGDNGTSTESAHNATAYHAGALALGAGNHVPLTNHFTPEGEDRPYQAQEFLGDHKVAMLHPEHTAGATKRARETGDLHKLAILDHVLGANTDRHAGNVMVAPDGTIKHIDNDDAFNYRDMPHSIHHRQPGFLQDTMPAQTAAWLQQADSGALAHALHAHGRSHGEIQSAVKRLNAAKTAKPGATMGQILGYKQEKKPNEA